MVISWELGRVTILANVLKFIIESRLHSNFDKYHLIRDLQCPKVNVFLCVPVRNKD